MIKGKKVARKKKKILLKGKKLLKRGITRKIDIKKILIIANLVFILGCCLFYGFRLIKYYKIEHPKIKKDSNMVDVINMKYSTVKSGDGLYEDDDEYYYKGKNVNNYVSYSGRLWRIVSIDKENNIKMITEDSQTSLVWGIDTDYEHSYVRNWLNEDNTFKSFFNGLSNNSILGYTRVCMDVVDDDITCNKTISDRVGLLSVYEYKKAGGENSYLNTGHYWWLSNTDKDKTALYVYSKGNINNLSYSASTYYSYGVRPVITLSGLTTVKGGKGTKDSPLDIDNKMGNTLKEKYIGEYIKYKDYNWRIIDTDNEYVKVVLDGYIKVEDKEYESSFGGSNYCNKSSTLCSYINNDFYNSIKSDLIIEHDYLTGYYDKTFKYDLNHLKDNKEKLNVGLLHLGELFVNDYDNYFLLSRTIGNDNTIYEVLEDDQIYAGVPSDKLKVRTTIYLKPDAIIKEGQGTKISPYILDEV